MRPLILTLLLLSFAASLSAATVTWNAPLNVTTVADALSLQYPLYITPRGSTTSNPSILVTAVSCSGAIPFTCTGTVPDCTATVTTNCMPTAYGTKAELSAKDPTGAEGAKSAPFTLPPGVPTGLRVGP